MQRSRRDRQKGSKRIKNSIEISLGVQFRRLQAENTDSKNIPAATVSIECYADLRSDRSNQQG
jgi:hypothetical protein